MTTPKTEIERILAGLHTQWRSTFENTPIADIELTQVAFNQLLESVARGDRLDETVKSLMTELTNLPIRQDYLQHFLKTCAHCALAIHHAHSGDEIGAWKQISRAQVGAGVVLTIFVSTAESKYKAKIKAVKARSVRSDVTSPIKEFVMTQWDLNAYKNPNQAGLGIASKFRKPHGNPERNLIEFGAESLSMERLDKTFSEWISKEIKERRTVAK
jgi:hypothetical protein